MTSGEPSRDAATGTWVVTTAWVADVLFALGVAGAVVGVDALDGVASAISLVLFLASLPIWLYALGRAFVRSAQGEDIGVGSLFFLTGSAPTGVRRHLLGATAVSVAIAAVAAAANPAAVLVPMLPLGLAGLWGAQYGTFPPRRDRPSHERH